MNLDEFDALTLITNCSHLAGLVYSAMIDGNSSVDLWNKLYVRAMLGFGHTRSLVLSNFSCIKHLTSLALENNNQGKTSSSL